MRRGPSESRSRTAAVASFVYHVGKPATATVATARPMSSRRVTPGSSVRVKKNPPKCFQPRFSPRSLSGYSVPHATRFVLHRHRTSPPAPLLKDHADGPDATLGKERGEPEVVWRFVATSLWRNLTPGPSP